jgi:hypothetical protein
LIQCPFQSHLQERKQQKNLQHNVGKSLERLRNILEMLDKREKDLQDKTERELSIAKANVSKNQNSKLNPL